MLQRPNFPRNVEVSQELILKFQSVEFNLLQFEDQQYFIHNTTNTLSTFIARN